MRAGSVTLRRQQYRNWDATVGARRGLAGLNSIIPHISADTEVPAALVYAVSLIGVRLHSRPVVSFVVRRLFRVFSVIKYRRLGAANFGDDLGVRLALGEQGEYPLSPVGVLCETLPGLRSGRADYTRPAGRCQAAIFARGQEAPWASGCAGAGSAHRRP